jgi:outer membrane protein assembly factor BamD (BamD/ComL family)
VAAADYFTKSVDRGETVERSMYNRALCCLQLKKYDKAKQDLEVVAAQQEDTEIAKDAADLLTSLSTVSINFI